MLNVNNKQKTLSIKLKSRFDIITSLSPGWVNGVTGDVVEERTIEVCQLILSQFSETFPVPLVSLETKGGKVCIEWESICMTVIGSWICVWFPQNKKCNFEVPRDLQLLVQTIQTCVK